MCASPIRIDRPPERHLRLLRHAVQRRLRPHLVEACVHGLRRVEGPDHRAVAVARQAALLLDLDFQLIPAHERMFAYRAGKYPLKGGKVSWRVTGWRNLRRKTPRSGA